MGAPDSGLAGGATDSPRRRLVLLTAEYPLRRGDGVFVHPEIAGLLGRFDEIVVFNDSSLPMDAEQSYPLPPGVRYQGSLRSRASRLRLLLQLCQPRNLVLLWRVWQLERQRRNVRIRPRPFLGTALLGMWMASDAALRREVTEPDVLTTVYSFWGAHGAHVLPWLPPLGGGAAMRLHRFDLYEHERGYLPCRPALFQSVRLILPVSDHGSRYVIERHPESDLTEKVRTSRLGTIDHGLCEAEATQEVLLVSCSHVRPVKRVHRILEMLPLLHDLQPVRWIHFGGGPDEADLRGRLAGADLPDGIRVELRGATPNSELLEFYRTHRVAAFINVSSSEGVPVSIMEAMSFGFPIIATDVGGTGEIVGERQASGVLMPEDFRNDQLAAAIHQIAGNPEAFANSRKVWEAMSDSRNTASAAAELISRSAELVG